MVIKTGIIPRVAFSVMGVEIYWYAILITVSIIIGFIWAKLHNGRFNIKFENILDLSLFMLPISIICARLYYMLFNFSYYFNNPIEILNLRNGGLAIYGALIGGIATIIVFCKIKKISILNVMDYIAPIIPLGQAIGRWGN
jgi:phosphatidylglycerol:prolipoprotein diacylglycerol transferase